MGSGWQYKQLYRSGFFQKALQNIVLLFLLFGQENHSKSHILVIKMQLAEPKMHFATYKTKTMARGPLRRVRGPERNQNVSARRAASKNRGQNFWNRVSKTSNRKTAPEAPKPS